jgi:hypothetical protein
MCPFRRLDAEISLGDQPPVGKYANAFRILGRGQHAILEFLVYTPRENKAYVVCRVRLQRGFVPLVRDQLQGMMEDPSGPPPAFIRDPD